MLEWFTLADHCVSELLCAAPDMNVPLQVEFLSALRAGDVMLEAQLEAAAREKMKTLSGEEIIF